MKTKHYQSFSPSDHNVKHFKNIFTFSECCLKVVIVQGKKKRDLTTVVDGSSWEGMMEFKPQDTLVKRKIFVPPGCLGSWLENREAQPTTSVTSSLSWTRSSRPAPSSTSCQSWFPHRSSEVSWGEVRWGEVSPSSLDLDLQPNAPCCHLLFLKHRCV